MAVELSTVMYDVPTLALAGKLQALSFYAGEEARGADKWQEEHRHDEGVESKAQAMRAPTQPPTRDAPYEIKRVTRADYGRVLGHLQRFFFKDEPLNVSVGLLAGGGTCAELEAFARKCMDHGCSYMAASPSGEVVGVAVNAIDRRSPAPASTDDDDRHEEEEEEEEEDCGNPKFQKILDLLAAVEREVDIFGRCERVDSVMNCKILSVDSTWRGRGIAKQLLDTTRDVARQQGQQLMRVDCTSHFSAKAIARLGFERIYAKKYAEYEDASGAPVFAPEPPHDEVAVYVQAIAPAQKV